MIGTKAGLDKGLAQVEGLKHALLQAIRESSRAVARRVPDREDFWNGLAQSVVDAICAAEAATNFLRPHERQIAVALTDVWALPDAEEHSFELLCDFLRGLTGI